MKRYLVEFSREADLELFDSYNWGVREWGVDAANKMGSRYAFGN